MRALQEFYRIAEQQNISVDLFPLQVREALSVMDSCGDCHIAIDPGKLKGEPDERAKLAHELGHCLTGAFYNRYSDFDCRQRHENKADKWAICAVVTEEELDEAVAEGRCTIWDLAEHFGVPEELMKKAVCWYTYGNLAADLYF